MLSTAATLVSSFHPSMLARPLWREVRPAIELGAGAPAGARGGAGRGRSVLLIPGFMAGDGSLRTLGDRLAADGHRPVASGIQRNIDCSAATLERLLERLEVTAAAHGAPVAIVGHSRGGLLGRALLRQRPDLVDALVTLGAPHRDPLALHPVLWCHAVGLGVLGSMGVPGVLRLGCGAGSCCAAFRRDVVAPVAADARYLSLYSRSDGVVDWRACRDARGRHAEVATTHCGMAVSTAVAARVSRFLAAGAAPGDMAIAA